MKKCQVIVLVAAAFAACATKRMPDPGLLACQDDLYGEDCSDDRRRQICEFRQAHPDEVSAYGFTLEECARFFGLEDAGSDSAPSAGDGGDADAERECTQDSDCAAAEPMCDAGECVACAENANCDWRADLPVCDATSGACVACSASELGACGVDEVCRESAHECVQCNINAECASNSESRCDGNSCVPCVEDADCQHLANKVCDLGQCVQCTGAKAQDCDGFVCDSLRRVCAQGVLPRSAELCESCVADAQCGSRGAALCLPTLFAGQERGYFCQPKLAQGESCIGDHRPYVAAALDAQQVPIKSVDGALDASCRLRATTCQALAEFSSKACDNASDDDACGVIGVEDGVCAPVQSVHRCSVPCLSSDDCNVGSTCPPGGGYCSL